MRRVVSLLVLLALGAAGAIAQEAPVAPAVPDAPSRLGQLWWMAGTWSGELFKAEFEEHWMRPKAGAMLGSGRLMRSGKTVFTEFLRIEEKDGKVLYTVWPGERGPTTYELTELKYDPARQLGHAIFRNPEHARQHTIEYIWNGAGIAGRIAGVREGEEWEQRFTFHASADGRAAPATGEQK